ncbi:hypothetical protein L211DRAFT_286783 [Terfezia boudieri ATCC MYA-4762]|uniref:Uncharacterized protein n=1 Tax=Terfezia boudieri ATCC MYA-4762 TaxID=1051890 RepID=A0A3N4LKR3_9PEZI|nr:hypothetical protein L211DRAFT_286783 [Terfezia boudieri ATCC MYA-4762]
MDGRNMGNRISRTCLYHTYDPPSREAHSLSLQLVSGVWVGKLAGEAGISLRSVEAFGLFFAVSKFQLHQYASTRPYSRDRADLKQVSPGAHEVCAGCWPSNWRTVSIYWPTKAVQSRGLLHLQPVVVIQFVLITHHSRPSVAACMGLPSSFLQQASNASRADG